MAKLSSYYTLCPLIDQQNLLGVEKDSDSGCAIVTLGRNIVIRYKLQDLKQVNSWTSKERLTTQVIYDQTESRYAAVFNENHVRVWSDEETDLEKVKRYKFSTPFHTILSLEGHPPVLVTQNGATASLEWALQNKKSWTSPGVLRENEKIVQCQLVSVNNGTYLCALTKAKAEHVYNYVTVGLKRSTYQEDPDQITRIELKRTSEDLMGHVVMQDNNNAYLLTLWSHGRLCRYTLTGSSSTPPPGALVTVVTTVSTKHPVVMTALNETTVAVYGADELEEGAVLMIYNVQFKLAQAVQKLKLYTKDAKLWKVEDKLLLAANRHLAIAPYRLAPQKIESLLGSSLRFKNNIKERNEDSEVMVVQESVVAKWDDHLGNAAAFSFKRLPKSLPKEALTLVNEGLSDAAIQQIIIPQLIERKDIQAIIWCLDNFNDIPEKLLVDLLAFCLKEPEQTFTPVKNGLSETQIKKSISLRRRTFLDKILNTSYSDICLLSYLKTGLSFNEVLTLLHYLIKKLDNETDEIKGSSPLCEKQLIIWATLLLDSHYQHYLLSQDPEILALFNKLDSILEARFQLIEELQNIRPMLERIAHGKPLKPTPKDFNKFYSIEEVKLY
ncbi:nucleolar protein 11 [Cephus cinctus]|uniref:Nucleolar protein 11 n=1 Tax=Cephus cinctus TaxID=211228 RepID=A0AAJ7BVI1_CEPCN|nr:nucleolar protein 11 [Cephus cinctus]